MLISPFSPVFFLDRKADGRESGYVQTFAPTDRILLQMIGTETASQSARVWNVITGNIFCTIPFKKWAINGAMNLFFAEMSFNPGFYMIELLGRESEPFLVTDDENILDKTTLIQYSMKDNRQRNDAVFFIDGMQRFFDFRVPGGFKDNGWSFGVESEQFVTPDADISQLYGMESTQKKFTLGTSQGCPVWFAEHLNRLLVCSHVYFDGVKYTRKESNVPELNEQLEGLNSFVFTQMLQRSVYLDPVIEETNHLIMRRVGIDVDDYRSISSTINRNI